MFNKLREWTNKLKIWYKKWVKINLTDIPIIDIILICCFIFILVVTYLVILKGVFHKERGVEYFIKCNYYIFGFLFLYIIIIKKILLIVGSKLGIKKCKLKREIKEANREIYDILSKYRKWECIIIITLSALLIVIEILLYYGTLYANTNAKPDTSIIGYTLTIVGVAVTVLVFMYTFFGDKIDSLVAIERRILVDRLFNRLSYGVLVLICVLLLFIFYGDGIAIKMGEHDLLKLLLYLYLFFVCFNLLALKKTTKFIYQQSIEKYLKSQIKKTIRYSIEKKENIVDYKILLDSFSTIIKNEKKSSCLLDIKEIIKFYKIIINYQLKINQYNNYIQNKKLNHPKIEQKIDVDIIGAIKKAIFNGVVNDNKLIVREIANNFCIPMSKENECNYSYLDILFIKIYDKEYKKNISVEVIKEILFIYKELYKYREECNVTHGSEYNTKSSYFNSIATSSDKILRYVQQAICLAIEEGNKDVLEAINGFIFDDILRQNFKYEKNKDSVPEALYEHYIPLIYSFYKYLSQFDNRISLEIIKYIKETSIYGLQSLLIWFNVHPIYKDYVIMENTSYLLFDVLDPHKKKNAITNEITKKLPYLCKFYEQVCKGISCLFYYMLEKKDFEFINKLIDAIAYQEQHLKINQLENYYVGWGKKEGHIEQMRADYNQLNQEQRNSLTFEDYAALMSAEPEFTDQHKVIKKASEKFFKDRKYLVLGIKYWIIYLYTSNTFDTNEFKDILRLLKKINYEYPKNDKEIIEDLLFFCNSRYVDPYLSWTNFGEDTKSKDRVNNIIYFEKVTDPADWLLSGFLISIIMEKKNIFEDNLDITIYKDIINNSKNNISFLKSEIKEKIKYISNNKLIHTDFFSQDDINQYTKPLIDLLEKLEKMETNTNNTKISDDVIDNEKLRAFKKDVLTKFKSNTTFRNILQKDYQINTIKQLHQFNPIGYYYFVDQGKMHFLKGENENSIYGITDLGLYVAQQENNYYFATILKQSQAIIEKPNSSKSSLEALEYLLEQCKNKNQFKPDIIFLPIECNYKERSIKENKKWGGKEELFNNFKMGTFNGIQIYLSHSAFMKNKVLIANCKEAFNLCTKEYDDKQPLLIDVVSIDDNMAKEKLRQEYSRYIKNPDNSDRTEVEAINYIKTGIGLKIWTEVELILDTNKYMISKWI